MVLTAPRDTRLMCASVKRNQTSAMKRKRLVFIILGLIFVLIYNRLVV